MRHLALRFSAPVFPGETLRTEMWRDGEIVSFRTRVVERDIVVLANGRMEIASNAAVLEPGSPNRKLS